MEFEDVLTTERQAIGTEEVAKAQQLLEKYKAGKAALDQRIIENEQWFRMQHWRSYKNNMMEGKPKPASGWLHLPIVCNTGGYETLDSIERWRGYIDIWLADLKYVSSSLSAELSAAPDYFAAAKAGIEAMMAQTGHPVFDADGILQKGVILRHLALPGHVDDSFAVLDQMAAWNRADPGCFLPSVMSQYTPFYKAADHGIGRRITTYEYRRVVNYAMDLGLTDGYMQQKSSAKEEYTPSFDLTGI